MNAKLIKRYDFGINLIDFENFSVSNVKGRTREKIIDLEKLKTEVNS